MTRRRASQEDSLELLLDTICNTFGGIIFIAILVAILLQTSGEKTSEVPSSPPAALLSQQLEGRQQELAQLESAVESQSETLRLMAPQELRDLLAQRDESARRQRQLENQAEFLDQQISNAAADRAGLDEKISESQSSLSQLEADITALQDKLEAEKEKRLVDVLTSEVRSPGARQEIMAVIQYDRLYLWHEYSAAGRPMGLNENDFVILDETVDGIETTPHPLKGIPLDGSNSTHAALRGVLRPFSPDGYYVAVVVRPDSFDAFKYFRRACTQLGFDYRLIPANSDSVFVDQGGSGGRVQ